GTGQRHRTEVQALSIDDIRSAQNQRGGDQEGGRNLGDRALAHRAVDRDGRRPGRRPARPALRLDLDPELMYLLRPREVGLRWPDFDPGRPSVTRSGL